MTRRLSCLLVEVKKFTSKRIFYILILAIIALIFIREPIIYDYNLQILGEGDISPYRSQILSHGLDTRWLTFVWDTNELGYRRMYPPSLITQLLIWMLAFFGLSGSEIYNVIIFISLLASGSGIFLLIEYINNSNKRIPALFGAIFYMSSPLIFSSILWGHEYILLSYAIVPWTILYYLKFLKSAQYRYLILSGLLFGLTGQAINYLPMTFIIIAAVTFFAKSDIKTKTVSILTVCSVAFLTNLYWILPNIIYAEKGIEFLQSGQFSPEAIIRASPPMLDAFLGIKLPGGLFESGIGELLKPWTLATIIIIVVAFMSILARGKSRTIVAFQSLAILSLGWLFVVKLPILKIIVAIVYSNLPFMAIFRQVYHLYFIYMLSLSILLGFSIDIIYNMKILERLKKLSIVIVFILLLVHSYPFITGHFGEIGIKYRYPPDQEKFVNFFIENNGDYRVALFPMDHMVRFKNKTYPNELVGRDTVMDRFPMPTFSLFKLYGHGSMPQKNLIIFIWNLINDQDPTTSEYLSEIGVKYIVLRSDPKGIIGYDFNGANKFFSNSPHFVKMLEGDSFVIYKNNDFHEWRFQISEPILVANYDFSNIVHWGGLVDIYDRTIKEDEYTGKDKFSKLLVVSPSNLNISSRVASSTMGILTRYDDPYEGWTLYSKAWWTWINLSRYPYDPLISLKNGTTLEIPFQVKEKENYSLMINYFKNKKGGSVNVYFENISVNIDTKDQIDTFEWKDIGRYSLYKGGHKLILNNTEGFNAIGLSLIQEKKELGNIAQLLQDNSIIYLFKKHMRKEGVGINNEGAIQLTPASKVWQEVDIINNGSYKLAIHGDGDFKIKLDDKLFNFSSKDIDYRYFGPFDLKQGKYNLLITSPTDVLVNYSFEEMIREWTNGSKFFDIVIDTDFYNGKYSLKVSTLSENKDEWSWIRSKAIKVEQNKTYFIKTHLKYINANQSHIVLEGYDSKKFGWYQIMQIPSGLQGSSGWREYYAFWTSSNNVSDIRFALNAGWIFDKKEGNATTWFDDIEIYIYEPNYINTAWLYSIKNNETLEDLFSVNADIKNYSKVNPTLWKVQVNATKPFMLNFAESYDPSWEARVYKDNKLIEKVKPLRLYGVINGFWINSTGKDIQVVIRYIPQELYDIFLIISGLIFILSLLLFMRPDKI